MCDCDTYNDMLQINHPLQMLSRAAWGFQHWPQNSLRTDDPNIQLKIQISETSYGIFLRFLCIICFMRNLKKFWIFSMFMIRQLPGILAYVFLTYVLRRYLLPGLCVLHHGLSIQQPKPIKVTNCKTANDNTVYCTLSMRDTLLHLL